MGLNKPVDFTTAKLLKEKGFDEYCLFYYDTDGLIHLVLLEYTKKGWKNSTLNKHIPTAPTIAEVVMWLYEKHGIWIWVTKDTNIKWSNDYFNYHILSLKGTVESDIGGTKPNLPTAAYEAAIEYVLTNLI